MPAKKYHIALSPAERPKIEIVARSHRRSHRERNRARILLLADGNREGGSLKDARIAQQVSCSVLQVQNVRKRACQRGALPALIHKEQENRKARALDGAGEAQLVSIACSQAPDGRKRWTLQLMKERLIQMEVVETINEATICRTLKKTRSSRG